MNSKPPGHSANHGLPQATERGWLHASGALASFPTAPLAEVFGDFLLEAQAGKRRAVRIEISAEGCIFGVVSAAQVPASPNIQSPNGQPTPPPAEPGGQAAEAEERWNLCCRAEECLPVLEALRSGTLQCSYADLNDLIGEGNGK